MKITVPIGLIFLKLRTWQDFERIDEVIETQELLSEISRHQQMLSLRIDEFQIQDS
jgi:hypothetical protein